MIDAERRLDRVVSIGKNIYWIGAAIVGLVGACIAAALWMRSMEERLASMNDRLSRLETNQTEDRKKAEATSVAMSELKSEFKEFRAEIREGINWIKNDLSRRP